MYSIFAVGSALGKFYLSMSLNYWSTLFEHPRIHLFSELKEIKEQKCS